MFLRLALMLDRSFPLILKEVEFFYRTCFSSRLCSCSSICTEAQIFCLMSPTYSVSVGRMTILFESGYLQHRDGLMMINNNYN